MLAMVDRRCATGYTAPVTSLPESVPDVVEVTVTVSATFSPVFVCSRADATLPRPVVVRSYAPVTLLPDRDDSACEVSVWLSPEVSVWFVVVPLTSAAESEVTVSV